MILGGMLLPVGCLQRQRQARRSLAGTPKAASGNGQGGSPRSQASQSSFSSSSSSSYSSSLTYAVYTTPLCTYASSTVFSNLYAHLPLRHGRHASLVYAIAPALLKQPSPQHQHGDSSSRTFASAFHKYQQAQGRLLQSPSGQQGQWLVLVNQ